MTIDQYTIEMDSNYQAHLIRLKWNPDLQQWRATVQDIHANDMHHFLDDQALLQHLKRCLAPPKLNNQPYYSAGDSPDDRSESLPS